MAHVIVISPSTPMPLYGAHHRRAAPTPYTIVIAQHASRCLAHVIVISLSALLPLHGAPLRRCLV
jgi:hypothetical protein